MASVLTLRDRWPETLSRLKAYLPEMVAFAVSALLAVAAGMLIARGNPVHLGLLLGTVAGLALLLNPQLIVWLLLVGTLLVMGPVGLFFPSLVKLSWAFSLLGVMLLGIALVRLLLEADAREGMPVFVWLLAALPVYAVLASLPADSTLNESAAGWKRIFQFFGLLLFIAALPVNADSERLLARCCRFLFWLALLQLPFALYQYLFLVPLRIGMAGGVVPIDIVSGSFEASMTGGGASGTMAMFLLCVLAGTLAAWHKKSLSAGAALAATVVLCAPLLLGETKVVLILLPVVLLFAYRDVIRSSPWLAVLLVLLLACLMVALMWVYFVFFNEGERTPEQQFMQAIAYNFGTHGYADRYSLNRTTAITFWFAEHGWHNPLQTFLGHGLGASYSAPHTLQAGFLSLRYPLMNINLNTLSTLLWDAGLAGALLFCLALLGILRAAMRVTVAPGLAAALQTAACCFLLMLWYSDALIVASSFEVLFAFAAGYLAWLVKKERVRDEAAVPDPRALS
ncbi:hypothetical protein [Crenobacter intestini]|uniref:O-antigen ligase domain-containing protein n=1 Tax=Crenobacter intestini TaxID=2563443 RepID=A0A4T0V2E2_9NEIS|nr:hypothetical protein [Crenobacter intestini]TIC85325.1 hypothetical protein E5K04_04915 [Crenobacter intestini]